MLMVCVELTFVVLQDYGQYWLVMCLFVFFVFLKRTLFAHQATAEANNLAAVAAAKDQYYKNMEKVSLVGSETHNSGVVGFITRVCLPQLFVLNFVLYSLFLF